MDKYVIDLDKVLDELEQSDESIKSRDRDQSHQYFAFDSSPILNSLIKSTDNIDVKDADFSIRIKPPKALTENLLFEDNRNTINKRNNIESENNLKTSGLDEIFCENESDAVFDAKKSDEFGLDQDDMADALSDSNLIECQSSTGNHPEDPKSSNVLKEEEVCSIFDQIIQIENVPTANTIDYQPTDVRNGRQKNHKEESYLGENVSDKGVNHQLDIQSDENIHQESVIKLVDFDSTIVAESTSNLDSQQLESDQNLGQKENSISKILIDCVDSPENEYAEIIEPPILEKDCDNLNEEVIGQMKEEDLDFYLSDLNHDLEDLEKRFTEEQPSNSDQTQSNLSNNQQSINEKMIQNEEDIAKKEISYLNEKESANPENEIELLSKEISEKESETELRELEEVLASQSIVSSSSENLNESTNADLPASSRSENNRVKSHQDNHLGGLVRNINYFERQEMPNGLTEEEQMLGKVKPFWIPDEDAANCLHCDSKFTIIKRRHHCRSCGKVLCSQCCNYKAKLPYLEFKESRVCQLCYEILIRIEEIERIKGHRLEIPNLINLENNNNSMDLQYSIPDPNNPAEYCSTIPPLEQISRTVSNPPTVMVPVGVLKRPGSSSMRRSNNSNESSSNESRENAKQVMFSDGVRPGGDLVESPGLMNRPPVIFPADEKPIQRAQLQLHRSPITEKIVVPFESLSKRIKFSRVVVTDPNNGILNLPPIINYYEFKTIDPSLPLKPNYQEFMDLMLNQNLPWITFGLTKNLHINAKIIPKTCCNSRYCLAFSSKGLASVGQDEIVFVLDCDSLKKSAGVVSSDGSAYNKSVIEKSSQDTESSNDVFKNFEFPRDVFRLYTTIYDNASKAILYGDLSHLFFPDGLFNNKENSGFIFTRANLQCFQNILIPSPLFLIAILIHKWEIPWAKVFPLRLILRLGYEFKSYPSPVISYANRKSAYFEIGHTIMNVLADFRNFHYTLSMVKNLFICVEQRKKVKLLIAKQSYEKVCKVLSTSNEHVLAFGGNLNLKADSHFVCLQNENDDEIHSQYQTELFCYPGMQPNMTAASFIVFSGALKSATGLKAKMNIVEDGLLIQIPPVMMEELRSAIKEMKDFKIDCCKITENNSSDEWVELKWVDNDFSSSNLGVRSQIDGLNLEGAESSIIFSNPDYANERYLIRWIEIFLLQLNDNGRRSEMVNINKLAESIAQAFCMVLIDYLDQLYESGLTKISLRISLDVDKVGYETGSGGKPLPPQITQPLDSALIPVIMENISTTGIEDPLTIELLFYVLLK
ncbi:Krueppel-like factor 2 [Sarcoptes scabiei]|nr:Krueppel-like factor 2 [Sarcoptes scabiei]